MRPESKNLAEHELKTGLSAEFERDIDEADILDFARTSGDWNPLHVDEEYAAGTNFGRRIVHGAFQVGLASALIGMHLPGRRVLLSSVNARFPQPLYFPTRVRVRGEITSWNPAEATGTLKVTVQEVATGLPTAEISLGFTFHHAAKRGNAASSAQAQMEATRDGRKVVLVTGASGDIGAAIAADLSNDYFVIGLSNRQPLPAHLKALPHVVEVAVDLATPGWEERVTEVLGDDELYAIVHAAWPGAPHGGLLNTADDILDRQMAFGTTHMIGLSRLLFGRAGDEGGRVVAIGSSAGSYKPVIALASYSLGKAALEHTVRLLAPELARKQITINAVCPSYVAAGMHKQANDRQQMREMALVPLGRLCAPDDIVALTRFLLSPQSGFVSGQIIGLSGAQL